MEKELDSLNSSGTGLNHICGFEMCRLLIHSVQWRILCMPPILKDQLLLTCPFQYFHWFASTNKKTSILLSLDAFKQMTWFSLSKILSNQLSPRQNIIFKDEMNATFSSGSSSASVCSLVILLHFLTSSRLPIILFLSNPFSSTLSLGC